MWTFTGALDWGYLSPEKETPTAHEFWCRVRLAMKCRWFCWWNIWIESSFAPGVLVTGNPGNTGAKHLHPPAVPLFGVSKFCCSLQQEVGFLIPTDYMALFEVMCYFPNGKYTGNMESMGIHSFFEGDLKQNPRFLQYMMLLFLLPKNHKTSDGAPPTTGPIVSPISPPSLAWFWCAGGARWVWSNVLRHQMNYPLVNIQKRWKITIFDR